MTLRLAAATVVLGLASSAAAQEPAPEIVVEVTPVLSANGVFTAGWNEFTVRLHNQGKAAARGKIELVSEARYGSRYSFEGTAPFAVGAGSSISVRVPGQVMDHAEVVVAVRSESGAEIGSRRLSPTALHPSVLLVDVDDPSHLRGAVNEAVIAPTYAPVTSGAGGTPPVLLLGSPRFDPATGDPILPQRSAGYGSASAVLVHTDVLGRLPGAELDALAGYVLAGGTLALIVSRPEDLRQPALAAFAGGEVAPASASAATLKELVLPGAGPGSGVRVIPHAKNPSDEVAKELTGFSGGNLRGSPYGSSAHYGLGEVHLLAFDPSRKPAVDDPWVQARVVDLARRAFDRRSSVVFPIGAPLGSPTDLAPVRKQLDPNEGSRWAIAAAALLLCVYAVVAGPVSFAIASRRGKPLKALQWLVILSALTFGVVVAIGVAAKGLWGRARHLTLVEAGAGMTKGTARRWRGFFASRAEELTVRTTDALSLLSSASLGGSDVARDHLLVDRDGARLVEVSALPWQTVVIREDGFAGLGDGISILQTAADDVTVTNRSGRALRAALLKLPGGEFRYFPRIEDGERLAASAARTLGGSKEERSFILAASAGKRVGRIDVHPLAAQQLGPIVGPDAPGLADAWAALEQTSGDAADWLPSGVAVLLAQLDGGEGRTSDAGLRLESDRLLVRVVGYGGTP